jgi:hypothetical protein
LASQRHRYGAQIIRALLEIDDDRGAADDQRGAEKRGFEWQ